jgi:hypothetical protein
MAGVQLERFHHGLAQIFREEEHRRAKFAASNWSWDAPKFESALDQPSSLDRLPMRI